MSKVAIVTGASSGIGKETALLLLERGYTVYALSRKPTEIKNAKLIAADVTKTQEVQRAVAEVLRAEGKIDLLVNNAGMGISGALEDTSDERAEYIFDVNLFGAFRMAREVIPSMRENGGGRIVNLSSLGAVFYLPFQGFYSATKAAINALFCAMQLEVRPFGIQITCVMPGDIKTGFTGSRVKNENNNPAYRERIQKSVAVMEKDEQNGMSPAAVAKVVVRQAQRKKPKLLVTVGAKYKLVAFLAKILPAGLVNKILYAMYGG